MVANHPPDLVPIPIGEVVGKTKTVLDYDLLLTARSLECLSAIDDLVIFDSLMIVDYRSLIDADRMANHNQQSPIKDHQIQCPSSSWSFFFCRSSISLTCSSVIFWT